MIKWKTAAQPHTHTHIHILTHVHVYIHTHSHTHTHTCICTHTHTHTHTHILTPIHAHFPLYQICTINIEMNVMISAKNALNQCTNVQLHT